VPSALVLVLVSVLMSVCPSVRVRTVR
jgi:hypothetical protein